MKKIATCKNRQDLPYRRKANSPRRWLRDRAMRRSRTEVAKLEEDENAQREFVEAIRSMLPRAEAQFRGRF